MDWRSRVFLALTGLALVISTMVVFPTVYAVEWVSGNRRAPCPAFVSDTLRGNVWDLGVRSMGEATELVRDFARWGTKLSPTAALPGVPIDRIHLEETCRPDWLAFAIQNGAILAIGGALTMFFFYRERWQRGRRLQPPPA